MAGVALSQDADGNWRWVCDCDAGGHHLLFDAALRCALSHMAEPCPLLGGPLGLVEG